MFHLLHGRFCWTWVQTDCCALVEETLIRKKKRKDELSYIQAGPRLATIPPLSSLAYHRMCRGRDRCGNRCSFCVGRNRVREWWQIWTRGSSDSLRISWRPLSVWEPWPSLWFAPPCLENSPLCQNQWSRNIVHTYRPSRNIVCISPYIQHVLLTLPATNSIEVSAS